MLSTKEEREHQQRQRRVKIARAQTEKADERLKGVDVSRVYRDLLLATVDTMSLPSPAMSH